MRKFFLFFFPAIICSIVAYSQQNLQLWYNHPAQMWQECVPLGNGRLGAMPDCGIADENIVLNDITLWSGGPQNADKAGAVKYLPEIRNLLFDGKNVEAEALANQFFVCQGKGSGRGSGANVPFGCYQMLGNLKIKYNYGTNTSFESPKDYSRSLSIDSAIAKCSYKIKGVTYKREYFTSFFGDVVVILLSADKPKSINVKLSLDRPERYHSLIRGGELDMSGQLNNGTDGKGMKYIVRVRIQNSGGKLVAGDSTLGLKNANSAIIYISAATDFRKSDFMKKSLNLINTAIKTPYNEQVNSHIKAYQELFKRASLYLKNSNQENASLPTDQRLVAFSKNPTDNGLPALFFQFGRYLLICSTRPGLLPPNLQGLWANTIQTPWNGDYHLDINVQMNHWPVEVTNLASLNEPFYRLIRNLVDPGKRTAKAYFNSDGWVAFSITNVWGYTSPGERATWGLAISSSGWLCQLLWNHFAFTNDSAYLRKIYPILKGSAEFYLNTLVKDPNNGWLVTAPSNSPENSLKLPDGRSARLCAGPTIDNQVIRELFSHVIGAANMLHKDEAFSKKLEDAKKQLAPNQIENGRLMEWLKPYEEEDSNHRHMSPLWALYPGDEITVGSTPVIAKAAEALIERRNDEGPGWSVAWKMNLWARLGDGNHALKLLEDFLTPISTRNRSSSEGKTYPNLFCGSPLQIDGNFGTCAGIAEMLIQSNERYINLLPALPDQWGSGSFKGLCVRGGASVNLNWGDHKLQSMELIATSDNHFKIKIPGYVEKVKLIDRGKDIFLNSSSGYVIVFLKKGKQAKIIFMPKEN